MGTLQYGSSQITLGSTLPKQLELKYRILVSTVDATTNVSMSQSTHIHDRQASSADNTVLNANATTFLPSVSTSKILILLNMFKESLLNVFRDLAITVMLSVSNRLVYIVSSNDGYT